MTRPTLTAAILVVAGLSLACQALGAVGIGVTVEYVPSMGRHATVFYHEGQVIGEIRRVGWTFQVNGF